MHLPNLVFICFCPSFTPAFIINKTRPFYNRQNLRNDKRKTAEPISSMFPAAFSRAIDGARTRGLDLGKVARYQLRHYRIYCCQLFSSATKHIIQYKIYFVKCFFEKNEIMFFLMKKQKSYNNKCEKFLKSLMGFEIRK